MSGAEGKLGHEMTDEDFRQWADDLIEANRKRMATEAAAPDMLEALKAALPVLEAVQRQYARLAKSQGMGGDGPVLEAVRAAIAKAEGRANLADANQNTSPLHGESGR